MENKTIIRKFIFNSNFRTEKLIKIHIRTPKFIINIDVPSHQVSPFRIENLM